MFTHNLRVGCGGREIAILGFRFSWSFFLSFRPSVRPAFFSPFLLFNLPHVFVASVGCQVQHGRLLDVERVKTAPNQHHLDQLEPQAAVHDLR